ncbi:hypothetical protein OG762_23540 [Streptomyces sp. NBC_01136]|uniref:hypothetical protein n=1 Tax=unclassified Streptomyces TaxID=2593676 RepID=UPI003243AE23|nr:hypothetical protein OG762_23540 [Streptomyces sp. NBC_01136]
MLGKDRAKPIRDLDLERYRALYGLTAVVLSNFAIVAVAIVGVWRLGGDKSVIIGVLTAAFTAVSTMTTAYLGIKAVSNTAQAMAQGAPRRTPTPPETPTPPPETPTPTPPAPTPPAPRTP